MIIIIERTDTITIHNGQPVRVWLGTTPRGHACEVFVVAIAATDPEAQAELRGALIEVPVPPEAIVPLWAVTPVRGRIDPHARDN